MNSSSPTPQCGYHHPQAGPLLRAQNDRVVSIVASSSALFPSIYLDAGMNTSAAALLNADYMSGAVGEAVRLATASAAPAQRVPVRAFAKPNYRDGQGEILAWECCLL